MQLLSLIRNHYPQLTIERIESIGSAGGFSGAQLWRMGGDSPDRGATYALRKWPTEHPSDDWLSWIHRVVRHAFAQGCDFVAAPVANRHGETISRFSCDQGSSQTARWEVAPWMPGAANFSADPNPTRLKNMMQALAIFHRAAAQVTLDFHHSVNLSNRCHQLQQLSPSTMGQPLGWAIEESKLLDRAWPAELTAEVWDLKRLMQSYAARLGERLLQSALGQSMIIIPNLERPTSPILPVQPILRDVWHDHVLFVGNQVSGMIDYGAMQIDSVVFDIARLLGTTVADRLVDWELGISAYESVRKLSEMERNLIAWIDQSAVLLGCVNWLRWLLVENRTFGCWEQVRKRVHFHRQRLMTMINLAAEALDR